MRASKKLGPNVYQLVDHYIGSVATPDVGESIAFCGRCEWIGHPDDFGAHRTRALREQREALDRQHES